MVFYIYSGRAVKIKTKQFYCNRRRRLMEKMLSCGLWTLIRTKAGFTSGLADWLWPHGTRALGIRANEAKQPLSLWYISWPFRFLLWRSSEPSSLICFMAVVKKINSYKGRFIWSQCRRLLTASCSNQTQCNKLKASNVSVKI